MLRLNSALFFSSFNVFLIVTYITPVACANSFLEFYFQQYYDKKRLVAASPFLCCDLVVMFFSLQSPCCYIIYDMKYKQRERIIIFSGIGVLALIVAFAIYLQIQRSKVQAFSEAYARLIDESRTLTHNYQNEVGRWKLKQYSNVSMISITDQYLPKFQSLVYKAKSLPDSEKYTKARDFTVQSFQSEIESYKHFRNLLATGNNEEDSKSTQLLSDALRYETQAFAAFNTAGR
jgi:hypothetical protein